MKSSAGEFVSLCVLPIIKMFLGLLGMLLDCNRKNETVSGSSHFKERAHKIIAGHSLEQIN